MKNRRTTQSELPGTSPTLSRKDFESDQDVRWCPGCGDYSILAQTQRVLPDLGLPRERFAFISGIGCSSRFPYYMNTYGFHTIHGRAPTIATGLKAARPELSVWVISGDGDALSIGGNHFIHLLRRNMDINVLLFNNRISVLTKGQYSPTSEQGKVTKSSPMGSVDPPFNPTLLALASGATFVARALDRDTHHLQEMIRAAFEHKGTSVVEVYQNCNVFNDGAFAQYTDRNTKAETTVYLEAGQPLVYGKEKDKGVRLQGVRLESVSLSGGEISEGDLLVHHPEEDDPTLAMILARANERPDLPLPIGVFRCIERPCYEDLLYQQIEQAESRPGAGDLEALIRAGDTWEVN